MPRIREEFDADRSNPYLATADPTETNRNMLQCDICGKILYVDPETLRSCKHSLEEGSLRFACFDCEEAADGMAE